LAIANLAPLSFVDVPAAEYVQGHLAVYELHRVELLRDIYAWAYERSYQQFIIVRDAFDPLPDPIQLRYRAELAQAIVAAVRSGAAPNRTRVRGEAERLNVPSPEVHAFVETAFELLLNLHDVTVAGTVRSAGDAPAWECETARVAPVDRS
jgi:hypothetical protein